MLCRQTPNPNSGQPGASRLYGLHLVAARSELRESLTSYVGRLAEAHGVLTSSLMSCEVSPVVGGAWATRSTGKGLDNLFRRSASLCSTGSSAANLARALEDLTGQENLRSATMLRWADVLPAKGLVRQSRAWCPRCYAHWRSSGHPVYDPLLWCLESVTICPIHKVPLTHVCGQCNNRVRHLSPSYRPGYCSECHAWLGEQRADEPDCDQPITALELARSCQIAQLLNAAPSGAPRRDQVKENLIHLVGLATNGNVAEFGRGVGVPKNTLWLWCNGTVLPRLDALTSISVSVGVQLSTFLDPNRPELSPVWPPTFTSSLRSTRRPARPFHANEVRSVLQRLIDKPTAPPPSMQSVSKRLDLDVRLLRKHFPDLCKTISQRHQNHIVLSGSQRVQAVVHKVTTATISLHSAGIYPSHRRVEFLLPSPGEFIEPCARNAWRQTVSQIVGVEARNANP